MSRKKPKRVLRDVCIGHIVIQKVVEALNSSDFDSFDSEGAEGDFIMHILLELIKKRTLRPRRNIIKTIVNLDIVLEWKYERSNLFRHHARMDLFTFDRLVQQLDIMVLFHNDFGHGSEQMSVER